MSKFDASIPVLTEVFQDQSAAPAQAPTAEQPAPAGDASAHPAAWPYRAAGAAADAPAPLPAAATSLPPADTSELDAARPPLPAEPAAQKPATPAPAEPLDWERLERQVSHSVLQQLTARVDFVLEQRINDSMEEVLDRALRRLTEELRAGLHDTLGKIVTRAVQQEIAHLQASAPQQDDKR
ncbi:MAG TPA: hypothetical protein VGF27_18780 [Pseudoduganella sp.]